MLCLRGSSLTASNERRFCKEGAELHIPALRTSIQNALRWLSLHSNSRQFRKEKARHDLRICRPLRHCKGLPGLAWLLPGPAATQLSLATGTRKEMPLGGALAQASMCRRRLSALGGIFPLNNGAFSLGQPLNGAVEDLLLEREHFSPLCAPVCVWDRS